MTYYVEDAVAWVADAGSYDELVEIVRQIAERLPANELDGEPVSPELAREMRVAVVAQLRDETLPSLTPRQALQILDVLAEHHWLELESLRPALEHASATAPASAEPLPPPPTDEERFALLVAAGRVAEARALCVQVAAWYLDDEQSCMRVGDFGEATKAERKKLEWLERAKTLEGRE